MCHVLGLADDRALVPAVHLGLAMQLTNICRDVDEDWQLGRLYLPGELLRRATRGAPIFNAWFFRKRLFDTLGDFDDRYLYVADRDLLIRMALRHTAYACLDKPLYRYRMHAGSYTLSGRDSGEDPFMFECRALAERYLGRSDLPRSALRCFKVWHSQITSDHIVTAWHTKGYRRIAGYALTGLRHNLGWPVVFAGKAWERLTGPAA